MPAEFVHFRVHSAFSLAEGALPVADIARICKTNAMPAVALTDSNNLFGAFAFSSACIKKGIQPIIGCQLALKSDDEDPRYARRSTEQQAPGFSWDHLPLIARNEVGYKNLLRLSSQAYRRARNEEGKAFIAWEDLAGKTEGLVALTGGAKGMLNPLIEEHEDLAKKRLERLVGLFGENLYIELSRQGRRHEVAVEPTLIQWAYDKGLPLLATNNAFFETDKMADAHEALLCIADGTYVTSADRQHSSPHFRLKTPGEMQAIFADVPEALANTISLAKRCHYYVKPAGPIMPHFPTPRGEDAELDLQAHQGLEMRLETIVKPLLEPGKTIDSMRKIYDERLTYELSIIKKMGFSGYFLIVADFIQWAKAQNIPVGPGRGSGAGSLVSWSLTITDVDPISNQLIFERFLNPERVSMPDFDVDFCQDRRDEVIAYVQEKYGSDRVAQIITFGKLQARAVLRDVGRVLQMPYGQVDRLSKLIPFNPASPVTLAEAIEQESEIKEARDTEPAVAKLLEIALMLEGLYRHASTHAAGIVIGRDPLEAMVPLYYDPRSDMAVTQFNMKDVEKVGQVKFDFLGLKTLTVIQKTCDFLKQRECDVNISLIPINDQKTFELLRRVETFGIFQLESPGMRDVLRQLQPERFAEIIALVALYRPGPMDDIPRYLACRHGMETVTYLHPLLEDILSETFGVMVYQEQVMQIAQRLAGYSLGAADMLRRAMGKKIKAEMDDQRKNFVIGCQKNDIFHKVANKIFDVMAKFAGYGFNKCHSTPYALIAYQTAYLKANYPVEFLAASMTLDLNNTEKLNSYKGELAFYNIPFLGPDVNISGAYFQVEYDAEKKECLGIRYALGAIKNVGETAMVAAAAERERGGPFKDIFDFVIRLDSKFANKRQMEHLICGGAFDTLHPNRHQLLANLDHIMKAAEFERDRRASQQTSLFGGSHNDAATQQEFTLSEVKPWKGIEKATKEFEALGFYLTQHPLSSFQVYLKDLHITGSDQLLSLLPTKPESIDLTMAGVVMAKQEKTSKKGQRYAFIQLSDNTGNFEATVFSEVLTAYRELLEPGSLLTLSVNAYLEEGNPRLLITGLESLSQLSNRSLRTMRVRCGSQETVQAIADFLEKTPIDAYGAQIWLSYKNDNGGVLLRLPKRYALTVDDAQTLQEKRIFDGITFQ